MFHRRRTSSFSSATDNIGGRGSSGATGTTLKFSSNHTLSKTIVAVADADAIGPHSPKEDQKPLKSNLKPSNFEHPILVDPFANLYTGDNVSEESFEPAPLNPDSVLCSFVNGKIIVALDVMARDLRAAVDILTFPVPVPISTRIDIFGRFKACYLVILSSLVKMGELKTESNKLVIEKHPGIKSLHEILKATSKSAKEFSVRCKKFTKRCHQEYSIWATLIHEFMECHHIRNHGLRLYGDIIQTPVEDPDVFENHSRHYPGSLMLKWSPQSTKITNDLDFRDLSVECQLEFLLEVAVFGEAMIQQSLTMMKKALDKIEKDSKIEHFKSAYMGIANRLGKRETRQHFSDPLSSGEFTTAIHALNSKKLELLNTSIILEDESLLLWKRSVETQKFGMQAWEGDVDPLNRKCRLYCCNGFVDPDVLIHTLSGIKNWEIQLNIPLALRLEEMITICTPSKPKTRNIAETDSKTGSSVGVAKSESDQVIESTSTVNGSGKLNGSRTMAVTNQEGAKIGSGNNINLGETQVPL